jgi:hypothetical protein
MLVNDETTNHLFVKQLVKGKNAEFTNRKLIIFVLRFDI